MRRRLPVILLTLVALLLAPAAGSTNVDHDLTAALAFVNARCPARYREISRTMWMHGTTFNALYGNCRAGDGHDQHIWFFVGGRFVGTDASHSSPEIFGLWRTGDTLAFMYVLYRPRDSNCCATGGGKIVRFRWTGRRGGWIPPNVAWASAGMSDRVSTVEPSQRVIVRETDEEADVSKSIPLATLAREHEYRPDDARGWSNVLAEVPLFAALNARHRRKVATAARIRRFSDGTLLVRAGQPGDALYVLLDGEVSVRPSGRPALTVGVGGFIGELALLDGGPRTATVVAKGPIVTLTITGRRFRKLLQSEPSIAVAVAEELARRLRTAHAMS